MKRFALLVLSFLIIAAFDWLFVSALLANGAEVPSSSSQVLEIPLPQTFAGCWSGIVDRATLSNQASWNPGRLRLCFKRLGLDRWIFTAGEMVQQDADAAHQIHYSQSFRVEGMIGDQLIINQHTTYRRARIFGWPPFAWHDVMVESRITCSPPEPGGTMGVMATLDYYEDGEMEIAGIWTADLTADAGGDADGKGSVAGADGR